jgi:hypothetical protein
MVCIPAVKKLPDDIFHTLRLRHSYMRIARMRRSIGRTDVAIALGKRLDGVALTAMLRAITHV